MGFQHSPAGSAELNSIFCVYPRIQTVGGHRRKDATSSRNIKHVFDFEKKPHRDLVGAYQLRNCTSSNDGESPNRRLVGEIVRRERRWTSCTRRTLKAVVLLPPSPPRASEASS